MRSDAHQWEEICAFEVQNHENCPKISRFSCEKKPFFMCKIESLIVTKLQQGHWYKRHASSLNNK